MLVVTTFADLQAALSAQEPSIEIRGQIIAAGQTLTASQTQGTANAQGMTVIRGGHLECAGVSIGAARRLKFREMELYAPVTQTGAIQTYFEDSYFYAASTCLNLQTIAGTWVRGCHFNGVGSGAVGIMVGASSGGYEALNVGDCLFESCFTDVRVGGTGNCVNLNFHNNWHDRPASAAYLFAPQGTANVRNVKIADEWVNGADYPICVSLGETAGRIDRLDTSGLFQLLGCNHGLVTVFGDSSRFSGIQAAAVDTGPLEPG